MDRTAHYHFPLTWGKPAPLGQSYFGAQFNPDRRHPAHRDIHLASAITAGKNDDHYQFPRCDGLAAVILGDAGKILQGLKRCALEASGQLGF